VKNTRRSPAEFWPSGWMRSKGSLLLLVSLAAVLRIYEISLYPLNGDEYGSIAEAKAVGLNWNSTLYSALMHYWIHLGNSELWLRLPSAIFGTATVAILFRVGEKLSGWRTGVITGLLAATSPFNIYHSQEVRFYSLFICAAAAFMLATIYYVDSGKTLWSRASVLLTGGVLLFSHFLGVLAIYAQGAAVVLAIKSRWSKRTLLLLLFGLPIIIFGLPLLPVVHQKLWHLYQVYGNAPNSSAPVITRISVVSFVKMAFAGFIFIFGYHVYPLRLIFVITGICLTAFLLIAGARRLWNETRWGVLPLTYLLPFLGAYIVLDSVGGRVASGVSPRHVAFVWPVVLLLVAIGLSSFFRSVFMILLVAVLSINGLSIWSGWQRDWSYGSATDYRSAAAYASRWMAKDTAIVHDGRSQDAINFYFPKEVPFINSWPYLENRDTSDLFQYQRLIFVTDDWESDRRRTFDQLIERLNGAFTLQDGRIDYPLFEYILDRRTPPEASGYTLRPDTNQVIQPLSIYGLEFQDLRLPISLKVKDVPLTVIGAYGLPDLQGRNEMAIPLARSATIRRLILLSDVVGAGALQSGQQIAEVVIEDKSKKILSLPLRLGSETTSWDTQCERSAPCKTVFQWHKRLAIVGQNSYEGALRDFQAGLHGVVFDLPEREDVVRLTIHYVASSGRLYVWALAVPNN
jgi:hypothetical protein